MKKLADPPTLQDFADLSLDPKDISELPGCRPGNCPLKLSDEVIQRFQAEVNWSAADHVAQANQLAREVILGYVTAYVTGGDQMLAVYHDKNDPTSLSAQFETLLTGGLLDAVPELRTYLTEYPRASPMESFLYWSEEQFGLNY